MRSVVMAGLAALIVSAPAWSEETPKVLSFTMKSLNGQPVDLSKYAGKVVLIVNVASRCGFTPQYEGLQKLHEDLADDGLVILGFPCNQFGKQEPGTETEIADFCKKNYGVTFDMFSKIDVNGKEAADLYKFLTSTDSDPEFAGPIKWNFEKFLIGRDGKIIARYPSKVKPESDELRDAVKTALAAK